MGLTRKNQKNKIFKSVEENQRKEIKLTEKWWKMKHFIDTKA